jgi:hypothetical protein
MPTVTKYGNRRVQPSGLPAARLTTPAETEISAGGALARAKGRAALRVAESVEGIASPFLAMSLEEIARQKAEERRASDETALLKAGNQIAAWKNQRLFDPTTGAFAQRGEAAFPLPEQIHAEYDQLTSAIGSTMTTPEQELAFKKLQSQEWQSIDLQVRRHVFGEMQTFREGELKSFVANKSDAAIRSAEDPRLIALNLEQAITAIKTNGPTLGLGQQQIDEQVHAVESGVHVGVITQLLTLRKTPQAEQYFTLTREAIAGDKVDDVQRALEAGTIDAEVLRQADRIIADGGTLSEQLNQAKSLPPEVREPVEQRLRINEADVQRQKRETEERTLNEAYLIVERTHSTQAIPPALKTQIGAHLPGLYNFAESLASGVPIKTDQETYYKWMDMAAFKRESFITANLLADKHRLSDVDFQELARLQLSMRTEKAPAAGKAAEQQLVTFSSTTQLFNSTLLEHGIDPNPKPGTAAARAVAQLRRQLELTLQFDQSDAGGKQTVTPTYIQQKLDDLIADTITIPGWFSDTTTRVIELTPAEIPPEERADIEKALRKAGRPVTDPNIMEVYIRGRQLKREQQRQTQPAPPPAPVLMPSH